MTVYTRDTGTDRAQRSRYVALARGILAAGLLAICGALLVPLAADAAATGSISGTVTSAATHGALEHIQVCAVQEINAHEFRTAACKETNSEGKYTISVEAGSYKVEFSPPRRCGVGGCTQANYITQYYKDKPHLPSAEPVNVEAGKTTETIDAEMQVGGQIEGQVTSAVTHGVLEHINVCALEPGEHQFEYYGHCAETSSEGKYTISGLATAQDLVEFSPGFECGVSECKRLNYITQYYNDKSTFETAEMVSVEAGKPPVEGIDAAMQVGGQITGTVTSGGAAVARALVCTLSSAVGRSEECVLTNSKGEYTLSGLASGEYKVEFNGYTCPPQGGQCTKTYIPQYYNDKPNLGAAEAVSVEAGKTKEGIDAELFITHEEEERAAKKKQEEEAAAKKKQEEEAAAKKHQEEEAAAKAGTGGNGGTTSGVGGGAGGSGSAGTGGGGAQAVQGVSASSTSAQPLTQAQKLAKALKACKKQPKKQAKCKAAAKKKYGPKTKNHKKK